jgi:cytochrome c5
MTRRINRLIVAASSLSCLVALTTAAGAYDGDWKRGRLYYQGVCTPCHKATAKPEGIPANDYTIAEWNAYLAADKHARGKDTIKQYVSQSYRAEIKAKNKVADRLLSASDQDLLLDVKAFVVNGAKDGDAPAGCN